MKKRILSLVLALSMMISLFPVSALAQTPGGGTAEMAEENGENIDAANGADVTTIQIDSNGEPVGDDGAKGENWEYDSNLTLKKGTYTFSAPVTCGVIIYSGATVVGGTFEGTVWNEADGKISGGTFKKAVSNKGVIEGGTFTGEKNDVSNDTTCAINYDMGIITSGAFYGTVQNDGVITGGVFLQSVYYGINQTGKVYSGVFKSVPYGEVEATIQRVLDARKPGILKVKTDEKMDFAELNYTNSGFFVIMPTTGERPVLWVQFCNENGEVVDITNLNGKPIGINTYSSSWDDATKILTFTMPSDAHVMLNGYIKTLEIDRNGKPVTEDRWYYNGVYSGDGWAYYPSKGENGLLSLSNTSENWNFTDKAIQCDVKVNNGAIVTGGTFYKNVENNGTVKNSAFYGTVTNKDSGKMENVAFVGCEKLTNSGNITGAVVRADGENMIFSNTGTIDNAVFDFNEGIERTRELKEANGKAITAGVVGCKYYVFISDNVKKLYVVGTPKLDVRINDNTLIANINGDVNYGNLTPEKTAGYQQFTVQSGTGDIVLNQIGAPDPSEVKHTLTLVNAELVDMTGTEFTENATIKIKPKFTDEEFELDYWTSEPTGFDVSLIHANGDGTYTLKMPGNELTLTANSRKKTYSLTVVNGYIGDATDIRSGSFEQGKVITIVADAPANGFAFVGWNALNGTTCPVFSSADKDTRTYKFEMPAEKVELEAVYEPTGSGELVLVNGVPDINNAIRRDVHENVTTYFGRGWEYRVSDETDPSKNLLLLTGENFVLDKNSSSDSLKCNLEIEEYTSVKGTIPLTQAIKIEGTVDGMYFDGAEVTVDTIGTVTNSILHNVTVTNNGNIKNCVSDTELPGAQALTEAGGATVTATLDGCAGEVSGETLYFTGTPTLKVKVKGATVEKANGEDVGQADENGWYTVTAAEDGNIKLTKSTPTPIPDDQPKTYTITTDIYGEVNGGASATVKEKDWVHMTVAEVPEGMTFDYWNIPDALLKALQKQNSGFRNNVESLSFQMPDMGEEEQTFAIKANFRSSELPGEDDGPSTLGTMATVAVGGAAAGILVWQGVSLGVDSYLQLNLPKGVAVPANRRELVVLLWETAGKPEAALPSLYSDVPAEEIELQKATRWAIDNGLVKPADDSDASRFDPDRYVTKYDVFGAWLKLKKLMK